MIAKTLHTLRQMNKKFLPTLALTAILGALLPMFTLYMSRRILDALAAADSGQLLTLVLISVLGFALIGSLLKFSESHYESSKKTLGSRSNMLLNAKLSRLPFSDLESESIKSLLGGLRQMEISGMYGPAVIAEHVHQLFGAAMTLILGIVLSFRFFTIDAGTGLGIWAENALLLIVVAFFVYVQLRMNAKLESRLEKIGDESVMLINALFMFIAAGIGKTDIFQCQAVKCGAVRA